MRKLGHSCRASVDKDIMVPHAMKRKIMLTVLSRERERLYFDL